MGKIYAALQVLFGRSLTAEELAKANAAGTLSFSTFPIAFEGKTTEYGRLMGPVVVKTKFGNYAGELFEGAPVYFATQQEIRSYDDNGKLKMRKIRIPADKKKFEWEDVKVIAYNPPGRLVGKRVSLERNSKA